MKMNVKGLVFVGFAAAVFAGAAQADGDKIVTSKTYVDNKITQTLTTSTTTAPSENAVKEALALKYDANNPSGYITSADVPVKAIKANGASTNLQPDANGVVELPAAATVNDGTLSVQVGTNAAQTFTANQSGTTTITLGAAAGKDLATGVAANDTGLVTGDQVNTAINSAINTASTDYATAAQGTTADSAIQSVKVNGTALTADANKAVDVTVPTAVTDLSDAANYQLVANISNAVATDAASTTKYPSVKAMKDYVDGASSATNFVHNGITDGVTDKAPSEDAVHDALALKANTADLGTAAAANLATNGVASGENGLVTGAEVNTAIQAATNGITIPANGTGDNECTANAPCALVYDGTSATWKRIQQ